MSPPFLSSSPSVAIPFLPLRAPPPSPPSPPPREDMTAGGHDGGSRPAIIDPRSTMEGSGVPYGALKALTGSLFFCINSRASGSERKRGVRWVTAKEKNGFQKWEGGRGVASDRRESWGSRPLKRSEREREREIAPEQDHLAPFPSETAAGSVITPSSPPHQHTHTIFASPPLPTGRPPRP